jgi:hypothetical protein
MVCKNCKRLLPQQINFCNGCGAKVIRNRLTMRNLFEDFTYRYLNYDNTFLRTFKHLFSKPEAVIESYINGTRKKYLDVIGYFAIAVTLTGFYVYVLTDLYPEAMINSFLSDFTTPESKAMQEEQLNFTTKYTSLIMMAFVPIYAFIAKIVFFNNKKFNFTELIVVFLYLQAQISIVTAIFTIIILVLGVDIMIFSFVLNFLMILYYAYCLKRLYKISTAGIVLRSIGCGAILIVVIIIFGIGLGAWIVTTDSGKEYIESQKKIFEAGKKAKKKTPIDTKEINGI